jgi:hypothetical protein
MSGLVVDATNATRCVGARSSETSISAVSSRPPWVERPSTCFHVWIPSRGGSRRRAFEIVIASRLSAAKCPSRSSRRRPAGTNDRKNLRYSARRNLTALPVLHVARVSVNAAPSVGSCSAGCVTARSNARRRRTLSFTGRSVEVIPVRDASWEFWPTRGDQRAFVEIRRNLGDRVLDHSKDSDA